jgi:hypothetical protein
VPIRAVNAGRLEAAAAVMAGLLAAGAVAWAVRASLGAGGAPALGRPLAPRSTTGAVPRTAPTTAVPSPPAVPSAQAIQSQAAALARALKELSPVAGLVQADLALAASDRALAFGTPAGSPARVLDQRAIAADLAAANHDTDTLANLIVYASGVAATLSQELGRWRAAHPGAQPAWAAAAQDALAAAPAQLAAARAAVQRDRSAILGDERGWLGTSGPLPTVAPAG